MEITLHRSHVFLSSPHWFLISLQSSCNLLNFIRLFVERAVGTARGKLKFMPSQLGND
jgi:hypothetical protein